MKVEEIKKRFIRLDDSEREILDKAFNILDDLDYNCNSNIVKTDNDNEIAIFELSIAMEVLSNLATASYVKEEDD